MVDNETVFKGKTQPLSVDQSKYLMMLIMADQQGEQVKFPLESGHQFLQEVVARRISALNLPIKFTDNALNGVLAFTHTPGGAVMILIDALTKFENETVTLEHLIQLYPNGFYDEETQCDYIDNYLKPRKVKWAEIY